MADSNQDDQNANGVGDVCEGPSLELVLDAPSRVGGVGVTGGDLILNCGGADVQSLNIGIVMPPEATDVTFGAAAGNSSVTDACEAPSEANPFTPFAYHETGCLRATDLGSTIDPLRSGAVLDDPGLRYPNAFYLFLSGGPDSAEALSGGITQLCSPGGPPVGLGRLNFIADTSEPASNRLRILQQGELLDWFTASDEFDPTKPLGTRVTRSGIPTGSFRRMSISKTTDAVLLLQEGDSSGLSSGRAWDICLHKDSVVRMTRVTLGIVGPEGASGTDLYLDGCVDTTPVGLQHACSDDANPVNDNMVNDAGSYAIEPTMSVMPPSDLQTETLYVSCLLYTSPSPRDQRGSRMPSSA